MNIQKILKGNTSKKVLERCMGKNDSVDEELDKTAGHMYSKGYKYLSSKQREDVRKHVLEYGDADR